MFQLMEQVNSFLERAALKNLRRISPVYVSDFIGEDIEQVADCMLRLVNWKLKANYEVECPLCGVSDYVVRDPAEIEELAERECRYCHEHYLPSKDRIWVTFDLTDEFAKSVKKKILCFLAVEGEALVPRLALRK